MKLVKKIARVYVATAAGRGVKVGYSAEPTKRLKQVSAGIREVVSLAFQTDVLDDAEAVEAMAHWLLREHHAGAEWFAVDSLVAIAAVGEAVKAVSEGRHAPQRINNATPFAKLKGVRIQLDMSSDEVSALDDWRAEHRVWSRSEAIRKLVATGLHQIAPAQPA